MYMSYTCMYIYITSRLVDLGAPGGFDFFRALAPFFRRILRLVLWFQPNQGIFGNLM